MEKVQLLFQPGDRREGYRWSATYQGKLVGLCRQQICSLCNLSERERLKGFKGGKLEVVLTLHRRPSFWEERQFYLGHIVSVLPPEPALEPLVDEGFEIDGSRLNLVVYRTVQGAVLVDPGFLGFEAGEDPSVSRLLIRGQRIIASLVTHGHLDHWNRLSQVGTGSILMSKLAFQMAARHAFWQDDARLIRALRTARKVVPGEPVLLDNLPLQIETFALAHSIPETMGVVIKGQKARAVHLGDFRFNGFDSMAKAELINRLSRIAREPVDTLCLTIFNAQISGFAPIEALVIDVLTDIMIKAEGRVIIACFSTNLERIRRVCEVAQLLGRSVQFLGAGMLSSQEFLGIKTKPVEREGKEIVFVTGCQSEEQSVLWRIAYNQNSALELRPDDTLVFSSRCVPGNEEKLWLLYTKLRPLVGRLIVTRGEMERLELRGLGIDEALTHVSGHECEEGLRLALEILRPKKVLCWPQASPQIEAFREIVRPLGIEIMDEKERIIDV